MNDNQPPDLSLASTPKQIPALHPPDLLSGLPFWQHRYLAALEAGLTETQALASANVSSATISDWTTPGARAYDPAFARAAQAVRHGVAVIGREHLRAAAQAEAAVMRRDAFLESRGLDPETGEKAMEPIVSYKTGEPIIVGYRPAIRAADRVANRRLGLEVAGAVGQGAQAQASATVLVQVLAPQYGRPLRTVDQSSESVETQQDKPPA